MSSSKLFQPLQVGDMQLQHRVVMAPLTRFRADKQHTPGPHFVEYYKQRASVPGTLLVTEATFIAPRAGGYSHVPGIWSDAQITAWKKVTRAVHEQGSFIYLQLWALGRAADPNQLASEDPNLPYISASDLPLDGKDRSPRPLTISEIREYIDLYAVAAENAVLKAGFDGVEIHGANGYLIDQFLQDVSNHRTDAYGGSVESRARFALEVTEAIVKRVGETKTGIRFSPWNRIQNMGMSDPKPTFGYVVAELRKRFPKLAYVHVVEPRVDGVTTREAIPAGFSNDFIREIYASGDGPQQTRLISAGAYTRSSGTHTADTKGDLIAYGRLFIANPDLPYRLKLDIKLTNGDRNTYYVPGSTDPHGYTDYPFANEEQSLNGNAPRPGL